MSSNLMPRAAFPDIDTIRNQINTLLNEMADGQRAPMPVDLNETANAIVVRASVPGIKPEDLTVTVDRGVLTIRGESREEREEQRGTWHLHERRSGSVYRSLTLPAPVSEDKAEARLKHGVLEITLPKTEKQSAHPIKVQTT